MSIEQSFKERKRGDRLAMSLPDQLARLQLRIVAEILLDTQVNIFRANAIYTQVMQAINDCATLELRVAEAERILDKKAWRNLL